MGVATEPKWEKRSDSLSASLNADPSGTAAAVIAGPCKYVMILRDVYRIV